MQEFTLKAAGFKAIRKEAFIKLFFYDLFVAIVLYFIFGRENLSMAASIAALFMLVLYLGTAQKLQERQERYGSYRLIIDAAAVRCYHGADLTWTLRFDEIARAEKLHKGGLRLHDETNHRMMEIPPSLESIDLFIAQLREKGAVIFQEPGRERSR